MKLVPNRLRQLLVLHHLAGPLQQQRQTLNGWSWSLIRTPLLRSSRAARSTSKTPKRMAPCFRVGIKTYIGLNSVLLPAAELFEPVLDHMNGLAGVGASERFDHHEASGVTSYCWPRDANAVSSSNSGWAAPTENAGLVVTGTAMRVSPST